MRERQIANHDVIVAYFEAAVLGARHHRHEVAVSDLGCLGVTCGTRSVAEKCCRLGRRLLIAHICPVLATSLYDITDVVEVEASGLSVCQYIWLNRVKRDQVLDTISTSLRLEHDHGPEALTGTCHSGELSLSDDELDGTRAQCGIKGNDSTVLA